MGNKAGKQRGAGGSKGTAAKAAQAPPNQEQLEELEAVLADVIRERAAAGARPVKFNRLLLKFPTLHAGFSKCKAVFAELGGGGAGLGPEQLREGCAKLGYPVSAEAAAKIFAATDLDHSQALDVREFIVVLAILHILHGGPNSDEASMDPDILRTFNTAEDAFLCFDSSRLGYIDKEELLRMMLDGGTNTKGAARPSAAADQDDRSLQSVMAQRFAELDKDGNGQISFVEFLFCLEGWVNYAEDEESE